MRQIADLGVRVALEGVGDGPLPLAPLGERPFHILKLAPAVVRDVHRQRSRTRLVGALTELGHALGAEVVADGVESADQLRQPREVGCDLTRGFHLGQPRPLDSTA